MHCGRRNVAAAIITLFIVVIECTSSVCASSSENLVKDIIREINSPSTFQDPGKALLEPADPSSSSVYSKDTGALEREKSSINKTTPYYCLIKKGDDIVGDSGGIDKNPLQPGYFVDNFMYGSSRSFIPPVKIDQPGKWAGVIDPVFELSNAGRLIANPSGIFSSFEILVERSSYTVRLYGIRKDNGKSLLFQCKAGLGSSEYPTPKGMFYLTRIYDDKPLWIPPPDRDWAWGQAPSHSVYGGHMIPFFTKQPLSKETKSEDDFQELDKVASQIKMVDGGMYRIHGTDSPWSIGSAQSHGCVRLHNSAVQVLADLLKMYVGTTSRGETANGKFVNLSRPVRITLY
jgi:hypothetical protein